MDPRKPPRQRRPEPPAAGAQRGAERRRRSDGQPPAPGDDRMGDPTRTEPRTEEPDVARVWDDRAG